MAKTSTQKTLDQRPGSRLRYAIADLAESMGDLLAAPFEPPGQALLGASSKAMERAKTPFERQIARNVHEHMKRAFRRLEGKPVPTPTEMAFQRVGDSIRRTMKRYPIETLKTRSPGIQP